MLIGTKTLILYTYLMVRTIVRDVVASSDLLSRDRKSIELVRKAKMLPTTQILRGSATFRPDA
jgi:hypothetical protein